MTDEGPDAVQQLWERERIRALRVRPSVIDALKVMRDANRRTFYGLMVASLILGVLPMIFTVATGALVAAIPPAVASGGLDTPEGRHFLIVLALTGAAYIVQSVPAPFVGAYAEGFRARVSAARRERVMKATLALPGIRHLEDSDYLDAMRLATTREWPDPGSFAVGFFDLITLRTTGIIAGVIIGARFDWLVGLVLVAAWIGVGTVLQAGQAESYASGRRELRRAAYFRDLAFDGVAAKETRIFGLRPWVLDRYHEAWHSVMDAVWKSRQIAINRVALMVLVVLVINVGAFVLLVAAARRGEVSIGDLTAVGQALLAVGLVGTTNESTLQVSLGSAAFPAILQLEEKSKAGSTFAMHGFRPADGLPAREIVFENVSFTYPGQTTPVYTNLNLRIPAGRSLGIVGSNGAGKTTLIKLLARFYDPDEGRITVDGIDLRELEPVAWQRRIAAIFQDFVHFEYSAADNVAFGHIDSEPEPATIREAADLVGVAETVEGLPGGWKTPLSRRFEGGVDLSGGQWQRLALARALYAVRGGAGVLVLDEPTANLDARSEVLLFDRFIEVTQGATSVLISHRFSTVRRADHIVVIEAGAVVEQGTHADLIELGGRYAHSFRLQADRYDDGAPLDDAPVDGEEGGTS